MIRQYFQVFVMLAILSFSNTALGALKIKLGVVTKPGSAQNIVAEKFKELIERKAGDTIRPPCRGPFITFFSPLTMWPAGLVNR